MRVVSNTSPLVALAGIGLLELLPRLFGTILIPVAVADELWPRRETQVLAEAPPAWLETRSPRAVEAVEGVHRGEEQAIALALEVGADLLLIDERAGRKAAAARRLRIAGTVGVLERAASAGMIDLSDAFARLKETDFWVSPRLLDERLARHERNKRLRQG